MPSHALTALIALKVRATSNAIDLLVIENCCSSKVRFLIELATNVPTHAHTAHNDHKVTTMF